MVRRIELRRVAFVDGASAPLEHTSLLWMNLIRIFDESVSHYLRDLGASELLERQPRSSV